MPEPLGDDVGAEPLDDVPLDDDDDEPDDDDDDELDAGDALEDEELEGDALDDDEELESDWVFLSGLDEAYRSLYQPPPLSWNDVRLSSLCIVFFLPHTGQTSGGGSPCFCRTSSRCSQAVQRYSKSGMVVSPRSAGTDP